jgi:WD40 repeat protein
MSIIPVNGLSFSPDGTLLASASGISVAVWNIENREILKNIGVHNHDDSHSYQKVVVSNLAFSPDGEVLASSSSDGQIRLWRLPDFWEMTDIEDMIDAELASAPRSNSLVFSPDGTFLVSDNGPEIILWDIEARAMSKLPGNRMATFRGHSDDVQDIAVSPDGTRIASGASDRTIRLWNVKSGKPIIPFHDRCPPLEGYVYGKTTILSDVGFTPDRNMFMWGRTDTTISVWNVQEDTVSTLVTNFKKVGMRGRLMFSSDFRLAALADAAVFNEDSRGIIEIWDIAKEERLHVLSGHTDTVDNLLFSPDGTMLCSRSGGWIQFWDTHSGESLATLEGKYSDMRFSPDGTSLLLETTEFYPSKRWIGTIQIWDIAHNTLHTTLHSDSTIRDMLLSRDGTRLAALVSAETGYYWDDGYGGHINEDRLKIWDLTTGAEIDLPSKILGVVAGFSPDGAMLVVGKGNGSILVLDKKGTIINTLEGHSSAIRSADFFLNGTLLVTSDADGAIKFWDMNKFSKLASIPGLRRPETIRVTSDGIPFLLDWDSCSITFWKFDLESLLLRSCEWLQDYLKYNPHVTEEDREVCDDILAAKNAKKR